MLLRDQIANRRDAVANVAARHGASNVRLFGSVLRGEETDASDVDLLVDMAPDRGWRDYLALVDALEALIGRRVDLVTQRGLSPHFRPFIEAEARPL